MEPVIYAGIGVLILLIIAGGAFLLAPSRRRRRTLEIGRAHV